jgi:hypothetical protein
MYKRDSYSELEHCKAGLSIIVTNYTKMHTNLEKCKNRTDHYWKVTKHVQCSAYTDRRKTVVNSLAAPSGSHWKLGPVIEVILHKRYNDYYCSSSQ